MGFLEWLGLTEREDAPPTAPSIPETIPSRAVATRSVTTGDAFSLSMVYRAVSIHVVSTKQLSLGAYRRDTEITAPALLRRPDIADTRSAFLEMTVVSLACNGNAYWKITRDDRLKVTNLEVLNPLDVTIETAQSGRVIGYKHQGRDLRVDEVQHLKLLRVPGTPYGLGPIQAAQYELRGALDLRDYSTNWFVDAGVPTGVLKSDQVLTAESAAAAKEQWTVSQGGKRGTAVLGNGLSYTPVYLSPADAQFLESQQFTVTQIARLFGVPSSLMLAAVEGNSQSYANVEQDWLAYTRFSLMQYLVEIEDAFSTLLPAGTDAKFNVEAILRSDTASRYAAHSVALASGFMTVDEVRGIENLPPLPKDETPKPAPAPAADPTEEEAA